MDVLFTGNLKLASEYFYRKFDKEYRCAAYSEGDDNISQVFAAYNFETVVYFSYAIDGERKIFDELEKLENVLHLSRQHKVRYFVYITSNEMPVGETETDMNESHYILRGACEQLCKSFAAESQISIDILKLPYIYQAGDGKCSLYKWFEQAVEKGKLCFPANPDRSTDFLCDEDLGELLNRMMDDSGEEKLRIMEIDGGNCIDFSELAGLFKTVEPELDVTYVDNSACVPICTSDDTARRKYGWFPCHKLDEDMRRYADSYSSNQERARIRGSRREKFKRISSRVYVAIELIVTFIVAEALNHIVRDNSVLGFIDFRLIGIVVMGTVNGLKAGVAAAVLSCIGYVASSARHTPWQILFYNIQNWLPFACYFLLGSICGYTRDKHNDAVAYAREEYGILEDKYIFLNDLYTNVLQSKEAFNSQIIGYRDSFGKIYSVVKKLDAKLPEEVFYEAVNVLEEILNNYYVAIYSVDKSVVFARQNVCSGNCLGMLPKSMKLTDYPKLIESFVDRETFVNKDELADYPAYAAPILRDDKLVGMIMLMKAEYTDMNMEFLNKFRIITDLIKDSLLRAMEYNEANMNILQDTRILGADQFAQVLELKRQMKKKRYLNYSLLKINKEDKRLKELNDIVCKIVRENDVLGLDEDSSLYLLLSQSGRDDVDIVAERMRSNGITFTVVEA